MGTTQYIMLVLFCCKTDWDVLGIYAYLSSDVDGKVAVISVCRVVLEDVLLQM